MIGSVNPLLDALFTAMRARVTYHAKQRFSDFECPFESSRSVCSTAYTVGPTRGARYECAIEVDAQSHAWIIVRVVLSSIVDTPPRIKLQHIHIILQPLKAPPSRAFHQA